MRGRALALGLMSLWLWGCGAAADSGGASPPEGNSGGTGSGIGGCFTDADCPTGLLCQAQRCVADDGQPPEEKDDSIFQRPQSSAHFIFALSTDSDSIAVIDPATLAIRTVTLPHEPFSFAVLPDQDAAVIVERAGESVSYLGCDANGCSLQSQKTARKYPAVTVAPDGSWALLWTPDPQTPDQGAEGVVALVDLASLAEGTPAPIIERATGRRDTNAFFRLTSGVAADAVVIGEQSVSVIDLAQLAQEPLPQNVALPAALTSTAARTAVSSEDGAYALLSSLGTNQISIFETASRTLHPLTMPGNPSDIELTPDGSTAVAVLRDVGKVARFPLPAVLANPARVALTDVALPAEGCTPPPLDADGGAADGGVADGGVASCTASPGQAALSPDGALAALFTNAQPTKSFAVLDLRSGALDVFEGLQKWVQTLGIGPNGHSAVVLHRANPQSTAADDYQQMVDKSQGYSVVDLQAGVVQMKLTMAVPPQQIAFAGDGAHAAVTLSDAAHRVYQVDALDLQTLISTSLSLASAPQFAGAFGGNTPLIWVTQDHPAGRISFVDLATLQVRTATGYALNAEIQP